MAKHMQESAGAHLLAMSKSLQTLRFAHSMLQQRYDSVSSSNTSIAFELHVPRVSLLQGDVYSPAYRRGSALFRLNLKKSPMQQQQQLQVGVAGVGGAQSFGVYLWYCEGPLPMTLQRFTISIMASTPLSVAAATAADAKHASPSSHQQQQHQRRAAVSQSVDDYTYTGYDSWGFHELSTLAELCRCGAYDRVADSLTLRIVIGPQLRFLSADGGGGGGSSDARDDSCENIHVVKKEDEQQPLSLSLLSLAPLSPPSQQLDV
jgi:hypothetical protein